MTGDRYVEGKLLCQLCDNFAEPSGICAFCKQRFENMSATTILEELFKEKNILIMVNWLCSKSEYHHSTRSTLLTKRIQTLLGELKDGTVK